MAFAEWMATPLGRGLRVVVGALLIYVGLSVVQRRGRDLLAPAGHRADRDRSPQRLPHRSADRGAAARGVEAGPTQHLKRLSARREPAV